MRSLFSPGTAVNKQPAALWFLAPCLLNEGWASINESKGKNAVDAHSKRSPAQRGKVNLRLKLIPCLRERKKKEQVTM